MAMPVSGLTSGLESIITHGCHKEVTDDRGVVDTDDDEIDDDEIAEEEGVEAVEEGEKEEEGKNDDSEVKKEEKEERGEEEDDVPNGEEKAAEEDEGVESAKETGLRIPAPSVTLYIQCCVPTVAHTPSASPENTNILKSSNLSPLFLCCVTVIYI